jgi:hypothetical protein
MEVSRIACEMAKKEKGDNRPLFLFIILLVEDKDTTPMSVQPYVTQRIDDWRKLRLRKNGNQGDEKEILLNGETKDLPMG